MNPTVRVDHNQTMRRFEIAVEGMLCRLDYRFDGAVLDLHHTEVPTVLEGRGLASQLVRAAFDYARQAGLRVRPSCSYVRAWVRRHQEEADLLAAGGVDSRQ